MHRSLGRIGTMALAVAVAATGLVAIAGSPALADPGSTGSTAISASQERSFKVSAARQLGKSVADVGRVAPIFNCDRRWEYWVVIDRIVYHAWELERDSDRYSDLRDTGGRVDYEWIGAGQIKPDCKIEIFGVAGNRVYTQWQTRPASGPWSGWVELPGNGRLYSAPWGELDFKIEHMSHVLGVCGWANNQVWCNFHRDPKGSPWIGWRRYPDKEQ